MKTATTRNCYQCNSVLIVVSSVTKQIDGSLFPQTTTVYRCSNQECQEELDRQTEKREQLKKERAEAEHQRAEKRFMARKQKNTDKTISAS